MAGLLDFLQAASNAAASNVSGPIDLLSMGLRGIGLPVPQDAFGGSEWMRQKGLIRDVEPSASSVAGETLGLLAAPLASAYKAPIARGLLAAQEAAPSFSSGRMVPSNQVGAVGNLSKKTQYEIAHEVAQRNAALPVSEGGLGLPANNTAMDRALAMGFNTGEMKVHGSAADIKEFKKTGANTGAKSAKEAVWLTAKNPDVSETYALASERLSPDAGAALYPVYTRGSTLPFYMGTSTSGTGHRIPSSVLNSGDYPHNAIEYALKEGRHYQGVRMNEFVDAIDDPRFMVNGGEADHIAIFDPRNIRSIFAAFDPRKRGSRNILAGAGATGLINQELSDYLDSSSR